LVVLPAPVDTEEAGYSKTGKNNEVSVVCIRNAVQKIVALIVIAQPKQPMLKRLETETPLIWESFHHVSKEVRFSGEDFMANSAEATTRCNRFT
jgi:hypothetical protein